MTSKADGLKRGIHSSLREAALIALVAGAGASLALMLHAGHRQNSRILLLLFGIWVLFPFVTGVWAYVFSNRWTVGVRASLYMVFFVDLWQCRLRASQGEGRVRIPCCAPGIVARDRNRRFYSDGSISQAVPSS